LLDWFGDKAAPTSSNSYLQTDGPSFTRSNTTVPQGMVLLESRYQYSARPNVDSAPQLDLRVGLMPGIELRAEWAGIDSGTNFRSAEDLELGFKCAVTKGSGWIPQSALLVELLLPTGYGPNAIGTVAPELDYIYAWSLTDKLNLTGSTGAIIGQPGAANVTQFYQSLEVNRSWFDQHLVTFYEAYSLFGSGTNQGAVLPSMDGGLLVRPTYNVQLDWRAGFGLNQRATGFFTGIGLCVRF
jgi:hypothetical protein